jgi:hypothetical protein
MAHARQKPRAAGDRADHREPPAEARFGDVGDGLDRSSIAISGT